MIYPIAVPSKNRSDSKLLVRLFAEGLPLRIFVEPQEANLYREKYPGLVIQLEKDDQGLAYVRNAILQYGRSSGTAKLWMLDDDIQKFHIARPAGFMETTAEEALSMAEIGLEGYTQGALEYGQFAWSHYPGDYSEGSYCDVCVLIDVEQTRDLRYRDEVNLKEDRDFTLQVLASGGRTRRVSYIGFSCPENGSNKGGLYEQYKAGKERQAAERLAELWPHCVTVQKKKSGRWDAKIDWRNVRQAKMMFG